MNTFFLDTQTPTLSPQVATIGFFDGVHKGHRFLIDKVKSRARADGMQSMVITFDKHPRQVLGANYRPQMLSTFGEKLVLLSQTGVDNCAVIPFSREVAQLSAREFMEQVLRDRLHVRTLIIGYDNRFGHNREETFGDYVKYGRELGIQVVQNEVFVLNGINVSSSVIRAFLQEGEVDMARLCLSYPYTLSGKVVKGFQEGRRLGFPTANMDIGDSGKLIPKGGVYAVKARLSNSMEMKRAMMNIGTRPTFQGDRQTLETFILDFQGDIYGEMLHVSFYRKLREEQKFQSVAELRKQLLEDKKMVEEQFRKL